MLTVGLVVEGFYDEAVLKELIQKCAPGNVDIICRRCGNAAELLKRFPGFLEGFRHAKQGSNVDKSIVIRDADQKNPAQLIARMHDKISGRTYPSPTKLLVIVQELEAWLLADEHAVSSVTGRTQAAIHRPEELINPKERLTRTLSASKVGYTAEVARKIAERANIDTIESRCSWFRQFRQFIVE